MIYPWFTFLFSALVCSIVLFSPNGVDGFVDWPDWRITVIMSCMVLSFYGVLYNFYEKKQAVGFVGWMQYLTGVLGGAFLSLHIVCNILNTFSLLVPTSLGSAETLLFIMSWVSALIVFSLMDFAAKFFSKKYAAA